MSVDVLQGPRREALPDRLTIDGLDELGPLLLELIDSPTALELDAPVDKIDSAGLQWLAMLVSSRRRAKRSVRIEHASARLCLAAAKLGLTRTLGLPAEQVDEPAGADLTT